MKRKSILEKLYYGEMAEHFESVSETDTESDFYYDKLFDEIKKYIPDDDTERRFHFLIEAFASSRAELAFKKGVRFATAFMSEAFQPTPKTYDELNESLDNLLK